MKRTIGKLKEMRESAEKSFIKNSIMIHTSLVKGPLPDATADLEMIMELNMAISVLENSLMAKSSIPNN